MVSGDIFLRSFSHFTGHVHRTPSSLKQHVLFTSLWVGKEVNGVNGVRKSIYFFKKLQLAISKGGLCFISGLCPIEDTLVNRGGPLHSELDSFPPLTGAAKTAVL